MLDLIGVAVLVYTLSFPVPLEFPLLLYDWLDALARPLEFYSDHMAVSPNRFPPWAYASPRVLFHEPRTMSSYSTSASCSAALPPS